jgi:hypothetical protein
VDILKSEYGMSLQEIRGCTRREISDLLEAMVSRKQGYPEDEAVVKLESTDEIKAKIAKARGRRFQGVTDGKPSLSD